MQIYFKSILLSSLITGSAAFPATAAMPDGYYDTLAGKSGQDLMTAVAALADGHTVITYNTKTWGAFEKTDVRLIGGRQAWWDMYSNNLVWLPDHPSLNIEHSVANSWWGGKSGSTQAYSDLFHLNPSDQNANNKKGSYPPGTVVDARLLDNGLFRIGTPAEGQGGGAASVFEPADEYKGDFARAYFYVFATYGDLNWKEGSAYVYSDGGKLQPWAADLLLAWHRADPVDTKELDRNEEVAKLQGNRNPFIDQPSLAEYIWGGHAGEAYAPEAAPAAADRPSAPVFEGCRMSNVNTYTRTWWEAFDQEVTHEGTLMLSIDGGEWHPAASALIEMGAALSATTTRVIRARSTDPVSGLTGSTATLTLRASDPDETDYTRLEWTRADAASQWQDAPTLLISSNLAHTLGTDGGSSSKAFVESAGFCDFSDAGDITAVPDGAATLWLHCVSGSGAEASYSLELRDIHGQSLGYWNTAEAKKMNLDQSVYTPATISWGGAGEFVADFGAAGRLQFNQTQPRFLNYTTTQQPVYLYTAKPQDPMGVGTLTDGGSDAAWGVGISGGSVMLPEGAILVDLSGRRVSPLTPAPGLYIVAAPGHSAKIKL